MIDGHHRGNGAAAGTGHAGQTRRGPGWLWAAAAWAVLGAGTMNVWGMAAHQPEGAQRPAAAAQAKGPEAKAGTGPYLRTRDVEDGAVLLELATKRFVPVSGAGPAVKLASAVHIADQSFYEAMQAMLDRSDVVLFEGVKPPGAGRFDPQASEQAKREATQGRLAFLREMVKQVYAQEGQLPTSLADLATKSGRRWKTLIEGSTHDAWGGAIGYGVEPGAVKGPAGEGEKAEAKEAEGPSVRLWSEGGGGSGGGGERSGVLEVRWTAQASAGKAQRAPNVQQQMAKAMGLKFQLELMDSSKPNWRNSDLSLDEMQARFKAGGADASALLGMLDGQSLSARFAGALLAIVAANPQMSAMLKMVMVDVLAGSEEMMGGEGRGMPRGMGKLMKVIVHDRNQVVLDDLRALVAKEPGVKEVAVFYGGGHMPDLEARLVGEMGYRLADEVWTPAIRANPKDAGLTPEAAKRLRGSMRSTIERQTGARGGAGRKGEDAAPKGDDAGR
jgi:hypothetical protein